jgi:hypothetical protein
MKAVISTDVSVSSGFTMVGSRLARSPPSGRRDVGGSLHKLRDAVIAHLTMAEAPDSVLASVPAEVATSRPARDTFLKGCKAI